MTASSKDTKQPSSKNIETHEDDETIDLFVPVPDSEFKNKFDLNEVLTAIKQGDEAIKQIKNKYLELFFGKIISGEIPDLTHREVVQADYPIKAFVRIPCTILNEEIFQYLRRYSLSKPLTLTKDNIISIYIDQADLSTHLRSLLSRFRKDKNPQSMQEYDTIVDIISTTNSECKLPITAEEVEVRKLKSNPILLQKTVKEQLDKFINFISSYYQKNSLNLPPTNAKELSEFRLNFLKLLQDLEKNIERDEKISIMEYLDPKKFNIDHSDSKKTFHPKTGLAIATTAPELVPAQWIADFVEGIISEHKKSKQSPSQNMGMFATPISQAASANSDIKQPHKTPLPSQLKKTKDS